MSRVARVVESSRVCRVVLSSWVWRELSPVELKDSNPTCLKMSITLDSVIPYSSLALLVVFVDELLLHTVRTAVLLLWQHTKPLLEAMLEVMVVEGPRDRRVAQRTHPL